MNASFKKLADGTWGIRVELNGSDAPKAGDVVTVQKRDSSFVKKELGVFVGVNEHGEYLFHPVEAGQYRFKKLGDAWLIRQPPGATDTTGAEVTVHTRNGERHIVLGERIEALGMILFRIADKPEEDDGLTPIEEPGAFKYGDDAYIVKPNKAKTSMYAMRVVEINADRLNAKDELVQIELEYEKGAMAFLREEHRMDAEEGKALSIRYGRCIVCSRKLKAAKSVEAGIGPVCIKRFK